MPAKRLSMRKIREVLRLKWAAGMSNRRIAASCGVSRPTVSEYLRRAESAGLGWPLPADMGDVRLERLLFPPPPDLAGFGAGRSGLRRGAPATHEQGRDAVLAVAGVSGFVSRRLELTRFRGHLATHVCRFDLP